MVACRLLLHLLWRWRQRKACCAKRGGGAQRDGGGAAAVARRRRQRQRWWRRTARWRQRGGCSADGGGLLYGGRRQFVGDVAVVWMMALGSGVCTMYNKNKCVVDCFKTYFFARGNCP